MTDLNEVSCRLIVMSTDKNLFEEFDVQPLQTLLANEPFKHFVHKKHFYTVESKYYCTVMALDEISFEIEGVTKAYAIKQLIVVRFIDGEHPFSFEVFVAV